MAEFKASVQYGDWEGTAAADGADNKTLEQYLSQQNLIHDGEFLIATHLFVGENHHGKIEHVFIEVYLYEGERFEEARNSLANTTGPIPVRVVRLDLSLEEYIGLFKRFAVTLTWRDLGLEGREFQES